MSARFPCAGVLLTAVVIASGCGKTDTAPPAAPAKTPAETASANELIGGDYIPPDALFVSVLFPHRMLSRPQWSGAPVEEVCDKINLSGNLPEMPLLPTPFLSAAGIRPHDVEHVVHVVTGLRGVVAPGNSATADAAGPAALESDEASEFAEDESDGYASFDVEQHPFVYGFLSDAYIVRLKRPVPRDAALDIMFRPQEIEFAGQTYFGQGRDTGAYALHFVDETTMIVGEERVVRQMLDVKKKPSPLIDAVRKLDLKQDVHCILHMPVLRQTVPLPQAPPPASTLDAAQWKVLTDDTVTATLSMHFDQHPSARLALIGKDAEAGGRIAEAVTGTLGKIGEFLKASPRTPHGDPNFEELLSIVEGIAVRSVNGFQVTRVESWVELSVEDLLEPDKLTTLVNRVNDTLLAGVELPPPVLPRDEPEDAASIRRQIPAAAGFPYDIVAVIAHSESTPKTSELYDKSLTVLSLVYQIPPPGFYQEHEKEFGYAGQRVQRAADIVGELARSRHLGYVSMIQPDRITDFACDVDGDKADGRVSFEVPDLYHGAAEFAAERIDGRWQINEFRLPVHRWRFVRQDDGSWKWLDPYGNMDDWSRVPGHPVAGKVTYQGEPLDAFLIFYRKPDPILPGGEGQPASGGEFYKELLPGTYHVVVRAREVDLPEKYGAPDTTDLIIEVKEGRNECNLELQPE